MMPSGISLHRLFVRASLTGAHVFAWVFLFQFFYVQDRSVADGFVNVLLTYALTNVIAILLTPLSAKMIARGYRAPLAVGTLFLSASFAVLAYVFSGPAEYVPLGIGAFAVAFGIYRALYWIPYAISRDTNPSKRLEWIEVAIALLPLLMGMYLTGGPASVISLMYMASIVALISIIPVPSLNEAYERFQWNYRETFHELFDARFRTVLASSIFSGIESAVLFLLWPITIFTLIDWSYPLLGVVMSLTLLFTMIARKLFSDPLATVPRTVMPLLAASGWVMRLGVTGFVGAVLVDTYFHTSGKSNQRGMDVHTHEHAADNNTYVDEYTALKEMGMALGRILICLVSAGLLSLLPLQHAIALSFILAAAAAGLSVYYAMRGIESY